MWLSSFTVDGPIDHHLSKAVGDLCQLQPIVCHDPAVPDRQLAAPVAHDNWGVRRVRAPGANKARLGLSVTIVEMLARAVGQERRPAGQPRATKAAFPCHQLADSSFDSCYLFVADAHPIVFEHVVEDHGHG